MVEVVGIKDFTLNLNVEHSYECVKCGGYCSGKRPHRLNIPAYLPEVKRILKHNELGMRKISDFAEHVKGEYFLKKKQNGSCIFYNPGNVPDQPLQCMINSIKPVVCQIFPYQLKVQPHTDYTIQAELTPHPQFATCHSKKRKIMEMNDREKKEFINKQKKLAQVTTRVLLEHENLKFILENAQPKTTLEKAKPSCNLRYDWTKIKIE